MKNPVQKGDFIEMKLPYARKSGEGVLRVALFGVCVVDGALNEVINVATEGVFDLTSASAAVSAGAAAYWDDTAKVVTGTATDNTRIGNFIADKAATVLVARVRLFC